MGLWPGDWYYDRRYDYASEYVTILRELWATGHSDFSGEFFTLHDCRLSPRPQAGHVPLVCAGLWDWWDAILRGLRGLSIYWGLRRCRRDRGPDPALAGVRGPHGA